MTIAELIERLQWQQEGRLQCNHGAKLWYDWKDECGIPQICDSAAAFRRKPDPPPMPDEVWLAPDREWMNGSRIAKEQQDSIRTVRYVRAGAIIPASQIEVRRVGYGWETTCQTNEYRIKP